MSKPKHGTRIKMIPIDRINILNPRVRNQKVFSAITHNISEVGLKKPITVTPTSSHSPGKDYDLVCGQGRLEAFVACGQKHIPAVVIDVTKEQAMIMSLVENLARRHHRALDLMQSLEILKKQGYSAQTISAKTGLNEEHVKGVLHLIENGEERLISAVEAGHIPITTAVMIADTPNEEIQRALQEAYETNQLRGQRLLMAKQLIEKRQRRGKTFLPSGGHKKKSDSRKISASDVLKVYQKEVDRKRMLSRKAEIASSKLVFVTEALWRLLKEDNFVTLLKAEGLKTMPKQLSDLLDARG